ncbi:MAG: hypothetical protein QXU27_01805 [Candidatus Anstonellales archaeon]
MRLYGKFQLINKKNKKVVVDAKGLFTYNMRRLFLAIALNHSNEYETIVLKDIYDNDVEIPIRQSFYNPQLCIVYNQVNISLAHTTGLIAILAHTSRKIYADETTIENPLITIPLITKIHREHIMATLMSYVNTIEIENDVTVNTVYIVNRLYDTYCQIRDILIDVFQFTDVDLYAGERYDAVYSIAFT